MGDLKTTAEERFRKGYDAGEGFAPDEPEVEAAVEALVSEGWTIEHRAAHTSDVYVLSPPLELARCAGRPETYGKDEWITIGGDAHGMQSWAVRIAPIGRRPANPPRGAWRPLSR